MYLLLAVAALNVGARVYLHTAPDVAARGAGPAVRMLPEEAVQNPLTLRERADLRHAMQRCWHRPETLAGHGGMVVVLRIELDRQGKLAAPIAVSSVGAVSADQVQLAFEAARRAFLRCQGGGYDLPGEKYEHWKRLDIGVNPEGVVAAWQAI